MDGAPAPEDTAAPAPARRRFLRSRGLKIPKDGVFVKGRIRSLLRTNQYEAREATAVMALVRPEDTVIELGAGLGYISTLMAKRGARAVHTFEANPHLIPFIESVYAANGVTNAHLHNAILGQRAGTATFYVRKNLLASSLTELEGSTVLSEERIEVREAGQVMRDLNPTLLVCDIEGAEADLIPAMDLSGLRAAVIELHPQWIGETGVAAVFEAFSKAGMTYFPKLSNSKVVCFKKGW